jgi:hypothetical protein
MTTATPAPASSGRATTALVLGILGFLCCQLCAPFAWYIGSQELKAIRAGTAPAAGEGTAKAGYILGIVGTVLLVFVVLWVLFFGGMAVLGALMESRG